MVQRACLSPGCIRTADDSSYCASHALQRGRTKNAKRAQAGDGAGRRLRAVVNKAGAWPCALCVRLVPAQFTEVDHVLPIFRGGRDEEGNLQVLCRDCHRDKTAQENRERMGA